MDFEFRPIIVEGVNHSGTRVLVDILSILGSDGGDYDNHWKENKFFLQLHKTLIDKISDRDWTKTILDVSFIEKYEDKCEFKETLLTRLKNELPQHYPNYKTKPWHWKCPTSALFEKTWSEIFPEAYYIIINREPAKVAQSFLRRKATLKFKDGLAFYRVMENKITEIPKKNQIVINFEELEDEIERIADFIPLDVSTLQIERAASKINRQEKIWYGGRSLKLNLKNIKAHVVYSLHKKGYIAA